MLSATPNAIEIPLRALWAHGFRGWDTTLATEAPPGVREGLVAGGTAWAASSFSANGYVPFQGAHETAALHDYFIDEFGSPDYTYITGASMGGAARLPLPTLCL